MVEPLNAIARLWWDWSAAMFWQVSLLIILIGCIDLLVRKWAWPQLRYALWSLILIKLVLPPTLSLPSGIVPELRPVVGQALRFVNSDKPAAGESPAIEDFGLQLADWSHEVEPQSEVVYLQSAGSGISNLGFQISDVTSDANPQSEIRNPQFVWQFHAMLFWLAGTVVLGIWLFLRLHSLCNRPCGPAALGWAHPRGRGCHTAAASLPQSFYNQMADCANRLGLRHVPRVVVTRRLASPAVFGALRPVLLMPRGYLSKLSRRDTEHMLLHELAHVKRGDLVMHSLYMLLQIVYWYNPLLWLVRRQMHHLRELSCDATVANLLRERTAAYRQTLLETARRLLSSPVEPGLGLLGLFEDSNRLLVRLNWLTKPTWRYRTMKRTIVVAIAALMIACVLPMAQARQSASNEVSRVTEDEPTPVRTEERDRPAQDQRSRELRALQQHLDEMMARQRDLQNELRILAQRRDETSPDGQSGRQYDAEDLASLQKHLDELMNQQQDLQRQLRALAEERRQAGGQREGRSPRADGGGRPGRERASEDLDVTVLPRESPDRERPPRDVFGEGEGGLGGGRPGSRESREPRDEIERARQERERAVDAARRAVDEAKRAADVAQARVQRDYADQMKRLDAEMGRWEKSEQMQQWRRDMETWQKQMQDWAHSLTHEPTNAESEPSDAVKPAPMPPMPPMPAMPQMGQMHKGEVSHVGVPGGVLDVPGGDRVISLTLPDRVKLTELLDLVGKYTHMGFVYDPENLTGDVAVRLSGGRQGDIRVRDLCWVLESALQSRNLTMIRADGNVVKIVPAPTKRQIKLQYKRADPMYGDATKESDELSADAEAGARIREEHSPAVHMPPLEIPAIEPPVPPIPAVPEVPAEAEGLREAVHHTGFSSIPGDIVLEVENHVGSITVHSDDVSEYVVRATIKGRAKTEERAREIAERLTIRETGLQNDDGVDHILVSKPEGLKDGESCVVTIEVTAPRKARLKLRQEVGDIHLIGLRGSVEAFSRVGSIRATDVSGKVALGAEVGGIDFAAPGDWSAKVEAKAEMGGIQSNLPLDVAKTDRLSMGHKVSGTIGQGNDNISLSTRIGSIQIRSQSSEPAQIERDRPEPRPEALPRPRPEREF